ncbi:hypothetical protein ACJA25_02950 [Mycoplasmopsis hyopharyngis]|uniref:hypothetical protein n=1 Tax=Mycoplasmopsis hyopharyngis TaxID=29558 RepID=UPI00387381CF
MQLCIWVSILVLILSAINIYCLALNKKKSDKEDKLSVKEIETKEVEIIEVKQEENIEKHNLNENKVEQKNKTKK